MTAKKFKKALKGDISFINIERKIQELKGYCVVFYNTPTGDIELSKYNLTEKARTLKAFTYSSTAKIIFIDGKQHSTDKLYLLLHEVGHICLEHIGDGKIITRNAIEIDIEADYFVYTILKENNSVKRNIIVSALLAVFISLVFIFTVYPLNVNKNTVFITASGYKFHRKSCIYTKDKNPMEILRSEAQKHYDPCLVCNP